MKRSKMLGVGSGYTIVEVLIFLAVSGALLVAAGGMISGRQERTRFSQSIDTMSQTLEDIFNDVSTGYYPSDNSTLCTEVFGKLNIKTSVAAVEQGTNSQCVFSGKLVNFTYGSSDYSAYTVISSSQSTGFIGGLHELAGIGTGPDSNDGVVDKYSNNADVQVKKVFEINAAGSLVMEYKSLIVESEFGGSSGASSSGNASRVKLYGYTPAITEAPLSTSSTDLTNQFIRQIPSDAQVIICLEQPGLNTDKVGYITISSQMRIERIIGSKGPTC